VEIDYAGAHCGMASAPASAYRITPPVVIWTGGFDGWREEYHVGASYLLDRGIAVSSLTGRQAKAGYSTVCTMDTTVDEAFSKVVDHLLTDEAARSGGGIWVTVWAVILPH